MTDFPLPADFTGYESRPYDEDDDDGDEAMCSLARPRRWRSSRLMRRAAERAEDEAPRDAWFAMLRDEITASNKLEIASEAVGAEGDEEDDGDRDSDQPE